MSSIAIVFEELENLLLATNNGSLYYILDNSNKSFIFCSERQIMINLIESIGIKGIFSSRKIEHLQPNSSLLINIKTLEKQVKDINSSDSSSFKSSILKNRNPVLISKINQEKNPI